jgi:hypothetical protein
MSAKPSNDAWPGLIDRLLDGSLSERQEARAVMWVSVVSFAEMCRLPLGALSDDLDVRRDVATRLLERLERDDFRALRTWRADPGKWWTYIRHSLRGLCIDVTRTSKRNIAPRGQPCQWVRYSSMESREVAAQLEYTEGMSIRWRINAANEQSEDEISRTLEARSLDRRPRKRAKSTPNPAIVTSLRDETTADPSLASGSSDEGDSDV